MKSVTRKDHKVVYRGPTPEIGDLACRREEPGVISSHWKPSAEELAVLNDGGSVQVTIWSEPIPPLAVNVETGADELKPDRQSACEHCGWQESKPHPLRAPVDDVELRICAGCGKEYGRAVVSQ